MAGHASDIEPCLATLPSEERQTLLCTVCMMRSEIASNCQAHGEEVFKLLSSQCPYFIANRPTCLVGITTEETEPRKRACRKA
jgi:hypothetical protein